MDEILEEIENDLDERAFLTHEIKRLESEANFLREQVKKNTLSSEINAVQMEILKLLEKVELLQDKILLASKFVGKDLEGLVSISLDSYKNCSFNGSSIEAMECELVFLTTRINSLFDILNRICGYIGHDYKYMGTASVFDFESMELCLEEREVYCCSLCGDLVYLDEKADSIDEKQKNKLKRLRKAKKMGIYQSKFEIVDNLGIIR